MSCREDRRVLQRPTSRARPGSHVDRELRICDQPVAAPRSRCLDPVADPGSKIRSATGSSASSTVVDPRCGHRLRIQVMQGEARPGVDELYSTVSSEAATTTTLHWAETATAVISPWK